MKDRLTKEISYWDHRARAADVVMLSRALGGLVQNAGMKVEDARAVVGL